MPQVRVFFLALLLSGVSCSKESLFDKSLKDPYLKTPGRTLTCTVLKVISQNPYKELPVAGAFLKLYSKNPEAKQMFNPVLATAMTDTAGMASFSFISAEQYFVQVNHNQLGKMQRLVKTPEHAVVNFEVFIYP